MKTFYWDFFGPHAEGTAAHFVRHLGEFLNKNNLAGCETGVEGIVAGKHYAAWCKAPEAAHPMIEKALKPKRVIVSA